MSTLNLQIILHPLGRGKWLSLLVKGPDEARQQCWKAGGKEVWGRGLWLDLCEQTDTKCEDLFITLLATRDGPQQKRH